MKAQRASTGITLLFNLGARWGGWSTQGPGRFTPGKDTRYPLYRRPGGPQGRSGRVRKIPPLPGLDTLTFQPVASRYTDYAILAHFYQTLNFMIVSTRALNPSLNTHSLHLLTFRDITDIPRFRGFGKRSMFETQLVVQGTSMPREQGAATRLNFPTRNLHTIVKQERKPGNQFLARSAAQSGPRSLSYWRNSRQQMAHFTITM